MIWNGSTTSVEFYDIKEMGFGGLYRSELRQIILCECGDEILRSVQDKKLLDRLNNYEMLKGKPHTMKLTSRCGTLV
jgi:hypothetical protein